MISLVLKQLQPAGMEGSDSTQTRSGLFSTDVLSQLCGLEGISQLLSSAYMNITWYAAKVVDG